MKKYVIAVAFIAIGLTAGAQDPQEGWNFSVAEDQFSPEAWLDLSYLNEDIAGENGYISISADGNSFVDGAGNPIRFWASNGGMLAEDLSDSELAYFAKFLAKRGVNVVRFHAALSPDEGSTNNINNPNMDAIDAIWRGVAAFKQEGIYSIISPHWPNHMSNIPSSWGLGDYSNDGSPWALLYFNETMQNAYKNWVEVLYTETNPYTGVALKDEPAVAIIQIQNEDGLFFWTIQDVKPDLLALIENEFYNFLIEKYGTIDAAYTAWNGETKQEDNPGNQRMGIYIIYDATIEQTGGKDARLSDQIEFYAKHQRQFYEDIEAYYRSLGCQQLINSANWKTANPGRLFDAERYTNAANEVIAVNRYYSPGHVGENSGWRIDPGHHYVGNSSLKNPHQLPINIKQVKGHPMMVTESGWNLPHKYQVEGPFLIAAYQSLTGVDAFFWFSPSDKGFDPNPYFDFLNLEGGQHPLMRWTSSVPGTSAMYPANAMLYRMGFLQEGSTVVDEVRSLQSIWDREIPLITEENSFDPNRDSYGNPDDPTETEVPPLAYLTGNVQVTYGGDPANSVVSGEIDALIDFSEKTIGSTTGELFWNYEKGVVTMNAPKAQGVVGFFEEDTISLSDLTLYINNDYAAVTVVPMDDLPLAESNEVLVQIGTVYRPANWIERAESFQQGDNTVEGFLVQNTGRLPWKAANTQMRMVIRNPNVRSAHLLNQNGEKIKEARVDAENGELKVFFPEDAMYVVLNTDESTVTSTEPVSPMGNLQVYPNPSRGTFRVSLEEAALQQIDQVVITDMQGKQIYQSRLDGTQQPVFEVRAPRGVYVVIMKSGDVVKAKKRIVFQ